MRETEMKSTGRTTQASEKDRKHVLDHTRHKLASWNVVRGCGEEKERKCGKAYLDTVQLLCWRRWTGGEREGEKNRRGG